MMGTLFRVQSQWTGAVGAPYLTTMNFGTGFYVVDDAVAAAGQFWSDLAGFMVNDVAVEVLAEVAVFDDVTGEIDHFETATTGTSTNGTNNGDPLPWQTQGLIRWLSGEVAYGHRVNGRTFIGGTYEDANLNGVPTGGYTDGLQAAADALIADTGSELRVWSRPNALKARPGASHLIRSATVMQTWAVLRSRRV